MVLFKFEYSITSKHSHSSVGESTYSHLFSASSVFQAVKNVITYVQALENSNAGTDLIICNAKLDCIQINNLKYGEKSETVTSILNTSEDFLSYAERWLNFMQR